jgi:hypothetical protein
MVAAYIQIIEVPWFIRVGLLILVLIFVVSVVFIAVRTSRRR